MPPKILGEASARFTDHIVKQADALQYELGLPCLIAWAAEETVLVNDVRTDPRWQWSAAVAALPIRSVVSAPLISAKECIGALKIYARFPHMTSTQRRCWSCSPPRPRHCSPISKPPRHPSAHLEGGNAPFTRPPAQPGAPAAMSH
jgi:hypothetical protein